MSSFKKHVLSDKVKWILTLIAIIMLTVALVFAFVRISKNETRKEIGSSAFTYSIGLLDEEGKYEQGTKAIYLKDYYTVDGLTIEITEDATITYSIYFYDADKVFIADSAIEDLSLNYDGSQTPATAEYFRIMITPTNDAEVSFFEINDYAGMLSVSINK